MTNYEKVFEEAIGNYGLITSAQAVGIGISNKELVKLAARGRLTRIGQGTYKLVQYAPAPNGLDAYADSVAIVGEGAYLYGESVLALCGLCPVDPSRIFVATDRRVRKNPIPGLVIVDRRPKIEVAWYEGIRCQPVADAIRVCKIRVMPDRLAAAAVEAERKGMLSPDQRNVILEELK